ncbi:3-oxo-tetronate kinase [Anaerotruncus rubiinfantis]|uniref:3-oxo-tetronate kinase n=1 Tax=Anaerotruncus rubiinfantis TaxID=1720200 RepID=UPI00082D5023|nr:3-oxo-tetronate kinase [Anaerotruncus rubiinfantis]
MNLKTGGISLGCVADDFTGASDAASFLAQQGIKTVLFNGIPHDETAAADCTAAVIALKTRSIDPKDAVADTRAAFRWLDTHGARQLYLKYCSTFDSTPKGNIGPAIDSTLEDYHIKYTLLCPSLPVNKRTVRDGCLYVDGVPLNQSPMKDHPLNPMWDSDIGRLMQPQGKYPTLVLDARTLAKTPAEIRAFVDEYGRDKEHFYLVPDYETEEQGRRIAEVFGGLRLLTGGSGLTAHLAALCREGSTAACDIVSSKTPGRGIVLSGSCSKATRGQILTFQQSGGKSLAVSPAKLLSGEQTVDGIWHFVQEHPQDDVLLYSAGAVQTEERRLETEEARKRASRMLEQTMAEAGKRAVENGFTRIIAAGGETSGAITLALGFDAFLIGESIAPGVPVMVPLQKQEIRLVLKSGNFGQPDFFARALHRTRG